MGSPLANSLGVDMDFVANHVDLFMLLTLAVPVFGVVCLLLLRSPRARRRLQLGVRRPSDHARSLPPTPARRAMEIKHGTSVGPTTRASSPQDTLAVSAVAEAIASQWDAEDPQTRQAYLDLSEEGESDDCECTVACLMP